MSEESGWGLNVAERFFGLLILVIGAISLYYTASSGDVLGGYVQLFSFLCIGLMLIGIVVLVAKTE